ncbi:GSCOCG00010736001-RA-CDS, partial [Cotesia congregata]
IDAPGTLSEGFRIAALPQATETGNDHRGIIAGKLNGQIEAVTPRDVFIFIILLINIFLLYTYVNHEEHLLRHQPSFYHFLLPN